MRIELERVVAEGVVIEVADESVATIEGAITDRERDRSTETDKEAEPASETETETDHENGDVSIPESVAPLRAECPDCNVAMTYGDAVGFRFDGTSAAYCCPQCRSWFNGPTP